MAMSHKVSRASLPADRIYPVWGDRLLISTFQEYIIQVTYRFASLSHCMTGEGDGP